MAPKKQILKTKPAKAEKTTEKPVKTKENQFSPGDVLKNLTKLEKKDVPVAIIDLLEALVFAKDVVCNTHLANIGYYITMERNDKILFYLFRRRGVGSSRLPNSAIYTSGGQLVYVGFIDTKDDIFGLSELWTLICRKSNSDELLNRLEKITPDKNKKNDEKEEDIPYCTKEAKSVIDSVLKEFKESSLTM